MPRPTMVQKDHKKFADRVQKLSLQLQSLNARARLMLSRSEEKGRNDRLSRALLWLDHAKKALSICCELLPYVEEMRGYVAELRQELLGDIRRGMEKQKQSLQREYRDALILEIEPQSSNEALVHMLDGCSGAMEELKEQAGCHLLGPKQVQVVVNACAMLCTLASEMMSMACCCEKLVRSVNEVGLMLGDIELEEPNHGQKCPPEDASVQDWFQDQQLDEPES